MSKIICILLSSALALCSVVLVAASSRNIKQKTYSGNREIKSEKIYVLPDNLELDCLGKAVSGIVTDAYAKTDFPEGIPEKLKKAYSVNKNLAGWLTIPGTEVDTAVLQSGDNSRYLTRNFYEMSTGELSNVNYGNLYLDYRCHKDSLSKNMVIYGHTTGRSDGIPKQVFRSLYDYRDKAHFIDCPVINYSTLNQEYVYKICAVFYSTARSADDNGYLFNYIYPDMSDNNMVGYIKQVKQRMLYETGVSLENTDKVIALSTCIYDYGKNVDTRLVVLGRLLHDGESLEIDPSSVKDNPDYRRPQVWYNAHGKTNPYKGTERWTPSPN
ncbi:MAG: class B sortase [Clostridiales bacterium]|nr:class B sortase [Clostridiales bacterium]